MPREHLISVEVGHTYLDRMDEGSIRKTALEAKRQLDQFGAGRSRESTSLVVLVDNYNRYDDPWVRWNPEDAQEAVVRGFAACDLRLDHVVLEASLAGSIEHMFAFLVPEPRRGEGSREGSREPSLWDEERGWLSNGDSARPPLDHQESRGGVLIDSSAFEAPRPVFDEPRHTHRIALDVQIWSGERGTRFWACPALAAWWQLVRLGALDYLQGGEGNVPRGTWSRPGAPPLRAKATVTFLPLKYIEIEHAVWNVLRQIVLPDAWAETLRLAGGSPPIRGHLDRISYVFTPSSDENPATAMDRPL